MKTQLERDYIHNIKHIADDVYQVKSAQFDHYITNYVTHDLDLTDPMVLHASFMRLTENAVENYHDEQKGVQ